MVPFLGRNSILNRYIKKNNCKNKYSHYIGPTKLIFSLLERENVKKKKSLKPLGVHQMRQNDLWFHQANQCHLKHYHEPLSIVNIYNI